MSAPSTAGSKKRSRVDSPKQFGEKKRRASPPLHDSPSSTSTTKSTNSATSSSSSSAPSAANTTNSWFQADQLRVLTLRQPWASSIMYGGKSIENRSWTPSKQMLGSSNGWFAVHAGATYESPSKYYTKEEMQKLWSGLDGSTKSDFPLSQILGLAHVSEVKSYEEMKDAPWALDSGGKRGSHCWIIDKVIPAKRGQERLLATKGALGLWKCPTDIATILHRFNEIGTTTASAATTTTILSLAAVAGKERSDDDVSPAKRVGHVKGVQEKGENDDDDVVETRVGRSVSDLVGIPVDHQPPFDWSLIEDASPETDGSERRKQQHLSDSNEKE